MDFGLSEEQSLFRDALRGFLDEHFPVDSVRELIAAERSQSTELLRKLGEQGVPGILIPGAQGGSELGLLDAVVAAEELGRAANPLSFHSSCVMAPLALRPAADRRAEDALKTVAAGEQILSCVHTGVDFVDGRLNGTARFVPDAMEADAFVVLAGGGGNSTLHLIESDRAGLSREPLLTVDETRRVGELSFQDVETEPIASLGVADTERLIDAGRIALAADAVGSAQRALDEAVAYSLDRKQFGRVIGSFQAVKHMCAETVAELEPVRSLLWYAAFAWDEQREDSSAVASVLKAHATEVATAATTTCVQVFGGMGFTDECDVQLWFKRAGYDRQMLGSPTALRAQAAEFDGWL